MATDHVLARNGKPVGGLIRRDDPLEDWPGKSGVKAEFLTAMLDLRVVVGAENRPADLGHPLVWIGNVSGIDDVVLAYRAIDADLVGGHVGAELAVGDVDVLMRSPMGEDGKFCFGDHKRRDPPDRACLPFGGNEDGGLAATVLEELTGKEAAARSGDVNSLGSDHASQLTERSLPPGEQVVSINDLSHSEGGDRPGGAVFNGDC